VTVEVTALHVGAVFGIGAVVGMSVGFVFDGRSIVHNPLCVDRGPERIVFPW
jgi:hypothetical protein